MGGFWGLAWVIFCDLGWEYFPWNGWKALNHLLNHLSWCTSCSASTKGTFPIRDLGLVYERVALLSFREAILGLREIGGNIPQILSYRFFRFLFSGADLLPRKQRNRYTREVSVMQTWTWHWRNQSTYALHSSSMQISFMKQRSVLLITRPFTSKKIEVQSTQLKLINPRTTDLDFKLHYSWN